jgi:hypothetical protein
MLRELKAENMPLARKVLKHVQLSYEGGKKKEVGEEAEVALITSDPLSEEEKSLLGWATVPPPGTKILLHSCCAPCSGAMVEEMWQKMDLDVCIFFYNPNIHPRKEYVIRKEENKRYAERHGIPFVDCDYDSESWFKRMVGFELEPERGVRCSACFDMRMEVTAAFAVENGYTHFTTTNATSRWKDETQVNVSGIRAAKHHQEMGKDLSFWVYNWQSDEMTRRKYEVSVEEKFYKQEYCGCSYSLRDSNIWRAQQGIDPIRIGGETAGLGTRYFEDVDVDAAEESQEVVDSFFKDANSHFGDEKRTVRQTQKIASVFEGREKSGQELALNNW